MKPNSQHRQGEEMAPSPTEFYAMIRKSSPCFSRDDDRPFAINFVPESDGHIVHGMGIQFGKRFRMADLFFLYPSLGPEHGEPSGESSAANKWFIVMPNQLNPPPFGYITGDGYITEDGARVDHESN